MKKEDYLAFASRFGGLRVGLIGDFCLDRYLEIDPARAEVSIETGLAVHNVVNVRSQPGGAGTILNNLLALGVGEVHLAGFCGRDGEGTELRQALEKSDAVQMEFLIASRHRRTFTYTKPLLLSPGQAPRELNRLDFKNWTPTPPVLERRLCQAVERIAAKSDVLILLDQVDLPETGVVTRRVLEAVREVQDRRPELPVIADSRRGLGDFPPMIFKMNRQELMALGNGPAGSLREVREQARQLSNRNGHPVFVTLSEEGIIVATPNGAVEHALSLPVRGAIDVVGAGDAVTANLAVGLAAGLSPLAIISAANAAASVVLHQLGTTGTATPAQVAALLPD